MPDFLNDHGEIEKHGVDLPHWQQGEVMQFVTFRLGDAMPESRVRAWKEQQARWLAGQRDPDDPEVIVESQRRLARAWEKFLDRGAGSCLLAEPDLRKKMEEVLARDDGSRVTHQAWVIMPNHVHLLFSPRYPLEKLIGVWKGMSARGIGRGRIWQTNYRDTLIRDAEHFANAVRYIRRNPRKLREGSFTVWEGERALRVK